MNAPMIDYIISLLLSLGNELCMKRIKNGLLREMSRILAGEKERIRVSLFEDDEYNKAVKILTDLEEYDSILGF